MVGSQTVAIIVSDVHLGAIGSNPSQFKTFLNRLLVSPNLHLILAGDILDLMVEPVSHIDKKSGEILLSLQALQEKGTKISMLLGNHEIPVIGPYDVGPAGLSSEYFSEQLTNLKLKLSNAENTQKFLATIQIGQYALLEKSKTYWEIQLYNSIKDVKINPNCTHHALIAHGFQFERTTPERSHAWKVALDAPDSLKDLMDFMFNAAIRPLTRIFSPPIWEAGPASVKTAIQTHKKLQRHTTKTAALTQSIDADATQVQHFSQEYLQTSRKRNYDQLPLIFQDIRTIVEENSNLHGLSYLLFGHTHEMLVERMPGKTTIINTGAWQHVRKMTYIEVDNKGNFTPKGIRSKIYWFSLLLSIFLFVGFLFIVLKLISFI